MLSPQVTILGGGPGGLAVGHFAQKAGLSFQIIEANSGVGGNAVTFQWGDFRFDSGAHRFHDKDPSATAELQELLGGRLRKLNVPSQIYHQGKWIDFPLSPLNLIVSLGWRQFCQAALSFGKTFPNLRPATEDFEKFAIQTYGRDIAERFLLHYSEKLWGEPCSQLSPSIAGNRLKGLTLRTFFRELLQDKRDKTTHLDGAFYYPRGGFGAITEALAHSCGEQRIRTRARVTKIFHDGKKIVAIEVNNRERLEVDEVVSTLPLPQVLRLLRPAVSSNVHKLVERLRFRNVALVTLFLDKPKVTSFGSVYFPDPEVPMTRAHEPRNRCPTMAPQGRTSLVIELPCSFDRWPWNADDSDIVAEVQSHLQKMGWVDGPEVLGAVVNRMPNAYPVLEKGVERTVSVIHDALTQLANLHFSGRNGLFSYTHVHDMLGFGKDAVSRIEERRRRTSRRAILVSGHREKSQRGDVACA